MRTCMMMPSCGHVGEGFKERMVRMGSRGAGTLNRPRGIDADEFVGVMALCCENLLLDVIN